MFGPKRKKLLLQFIVSSLLLLDLFMDLRDGLVAPELVLVVGERLDGLGIGIGESGGKLFCGIFRSRGFAQKFCCFDMLTTIYPRSIVTFFKNLLLLILRILLVVLAGFMWGPFLGLFAGIGINFLTSWGSSMLTAAYVMITEHRHIPKLAWYRVIWHIFMFPIFDIIGKYSMLIALFSHVEWKPILHNRNISIDEVAGKK